jgi:hypothetical protein
MTLHVSEEIMGLTLLQERHTCCAIMGADKDIQQHASSYRIYNILVGGRLSQIGKKDSPLGELVKLLTLALRLRLIVTASSIIEAIWTIWHERHIIICLRVALETVPVHILRT